MGLFRKDSNASQGSGGSGGAKVQLTKDDERNYKVRTGSVHDPILQAVQEAQPFEEVQGQEQQRQSYNMMAQNGGLYDVFGKVINQPDISNPTRSRDERPLDTIRGFEYSITGDLSYKDRLESDSLGFRVRNDFPRFGDNPYGSNPAGISSGYGQGSNSAPIHNFSGDQQAFEQGVYEAPAIKKAEGKKKKGLFGRKKK
ncbi:hypothetical protein BN7_168 [Wickerhamomyces ciferrii]|uniref:Meiotically up-regulated protein n=1 Tax=Wickerhamomyces ciferrii (strain ATCC 14091 / BCRC 22168 / CBS 111 / JCM 3599 / NBRC 0793 / NRRL Y-1031 F-60-10) TaxID=1206466 RepID=K0KGV8_WICCF|nr:uncharacterized protein BN7_168 [Wickerhamomyces ciferrii]CCH40634.1 hypothetical protein BN7_168 [Wickerhamomyces ciferrii]